MLTDRRVVLALAATLVVFGFSSLPGAVLPRLHRLDKAVHLAEYFLLGLAYLNVATAGFKRMTVKSVILFMAVLLLVAGCDELYQSLIPRRTTDWRDLLADAAGGLLALGLGMAAVNRAALGALWRPLRKE